MKKTLVLFLLTSLSVLISGCTKEETIFSGTPPNSVRASVIGIVLDKNNLPVNGVTVTAYSHTVATDQYGVFILKGISVNEERCIVQFSKNGFFNRSHAFVPSAGTVNYVKVILISNGTSHVIPASAGGTVTLANNASVQFAPNSFVTTGGTIYSGTVRLTVKHLSPDEANFGFMIPGGDLSGRNLNNEDVSLYTYGMIGVEITGNSGDSLQLATGNTASLTMPIAASQLSSAPATIPLWYFDEATSLWKEEGTATKIGNNYVGTVTHFSWWNCDYPGTRATIKGKVVDCADFPVPNVVVTVNGYYTLMTNQNGEYSSWIPSGSTYTIQVLAIHNPGWLTQDSQIETIPVLTAGQIFIVPDLVIPCPTRVSGTIMTCAGAVTEGLVTIAGNNQFYRVQYTQNGAFEISVIPNSPLILTATNSTHHAVRNIFPITPSNKFNAGNILLCNNSPASLPNNFTVTGNLVPNQAYNINVTEAGAQIGPDSSGLNAVSISITGLSYPQFTISPFTIYVNGAVPGTYTGGQIEILMEQPSIYYYMTTSSASVTLTQVDAPGGRVKGTFSGVFNADINQNNYSVVNITGNFNVLRTQ